MKRWTAWTAACLISMGGLLFVPMQTSAVDHLERTSLTQTLKESGAPHTMTKAPLDLRSESSLADTIKAWQTALSHENGFHNWQKATWNSYPLGPGTHGWVIILSEQGKDVGYMIINAAENGSFQLAEYGTGDNPLFSLTTLYRSLVQQELIPSSISFSDFIKNEAITKERLYMDALTALWKINIQQQTYYLDAKSGELLPLKEDPAPKIIQSMTPITSTQLVGEVHEWVTSPFDPYDRLPWVEGTPLHVTQLKELQTALRQTTKLTYVTELYNNQVTLPLAILGYTQWDQSEPYLALDHVGPRYVRLLAALQQGDIYP
ncbi:hypothetical protein [Paenibacillus sp. N3.4]|uniref:hypothetical protein n=1 Tax=Paenibacillus sp. N3.4 TaxID=2603222 RepID=UPI0011CBB6A8|nr:hypothetical protein [Paenibacillus sp. N3.4]TXK85968.1 hypothetical protein FU659_00470 [Paenibacillus sp. N3.4]